MRIKQGLSYANVMATLAFFMAASMGGAYAQSRIGTSEIQNRAVTTPKIARHAVTGPKIGTDEIRMRHLVSPLIERLQGQSGPAGPQGPRGDTGLQGPEGPEGPQGDAGAPAVASVTTRVQDGATAIVPPGETITRTVSCNPGEIATGGGGVEAVGFDPNQPVAFTTLVASRPTPASGTPNGWTVTIRNDGSSSHVLGPSVFATCVVPGS